MAVILPRSTCPRELRSPEVGESVRLCGHDRLRDSAPAKSGPYSLLISAVRQQRAPGRSQNPLSFSNGSSDGLTSTDSDPTRLR